MTAIFSLFLVISISILVTRIASVALSHTGLSMEAARFQARSAFTGVGFTTTESEKLVNHPVRRRILLLLMLLGNAGIVSAVSSLLLTGISFRGDEDSPVLKVVLLVSGVVALWAIAMSSWVDRHLSRFISWTLQKYTRLEVTDYASLLQLTGDYRVSELQAEPQDWLADRPLRELDLRAEGVVVLGVKRESGEYLGVPDGDTEIHSGDVAIVYGRSGSLERLDQRRKDRRGELEHRKAVKDQEAVAEQEKEEDSTGRPKD